MGTGLKERTQDSIDIQIIVDTMRAELAQRHPKIIMHDGVLDHSVMTADSDYGYDWLAGIIAEVIGRYGPIRSTPLMQILKLVFTRLNDEEIRQTSRELKKYDVELTEDRRWVVVSKLNSLRKSD